MGQKDLAKDRLAVCSQEEPAQIFSELGISEFGLDQEQAEASRELYGENQITGQRKDTVLFRLRRAFVNPLSVVLLMLAAISFLTDVVFVSNFSRNITTSAIILTMLLISGAVRFFQELRSRKVTNRLIRLVNTAVWVRRSGRWTELSSDQLCVGDLVRLEAGDRVPADIRLVRASDFFVSQSVITGESGILEKSTAPLTSMPKSISDYRNTVFFGSTVTGGTAEGVVLCVGQDTLYGGISPEGTQRKNGFDRGENSIAWVLIRFMALLIPIVFVTCGVSKNDWLEAFLFALSVAVGLMPELLPMVITACLSRGSSLMGQKQTIVKNINAMQEFGSMDVLCVDKTGTLTGDTILLEYYMDVLGNESQRTLDYAFLNSFYHTGVSNHLDAAILKAQEMPGKRAAFLKLARAHRKLDELPFDYNRKFADVLLQTEKGPFLIIKGSVDEVVSRCRYADYHGACHEISSGDLEGMHAIVDEMLEDGMKVLAVAGKWLDASTLTAGDEYDLTLYGYLAFFDAPRKTASSAVQKLHGLHIGVKVLAGDRADVAASVCRRLGIPADDVLTGSLLNTLSDDELPVRIEKTHIFAELSPGQKAQIVRLLQENGHTTGFLGDGMNDLPAIVQADVGISVDTATEAVKDGADVILLRKDLNVVGDGVVEGRKAFANMSKYIRITASSNFGNICAIVTAGVLLPFFPMTSVQLLLLNLLYDLLCLVLPWDRVDPELCERPLEWSGRTLGRFMTFFGPLSSVFDILTFAFLYFVLCPAVCGGSFPALTAQGQAQFIALFQTGWFLESMWTQVLILHLLRTRRLPFLQSSPSRPVIIVTVLGVLIFTALTMTPLGTLLGLTAMPPVYFCFLAVIVILYLTVVTWMKKLYMKRYHELT